MKNTFLLFFSLFIVPFSFCQSTSALPHLLKESNSTQLIVNNKPYLIYGGELGNSSASSLEYMKPIWPTLKKLHVNTVLAPVYWEIMEPEEGKFDFMLVDSIISDARKNNMKLVLLWFGSWKNSMSCYTPYWVKTNQQRFPRAQNSSGKGLEILSAFSQNNRQADMKAFTALMKHLKAIDSKEQTVIMVQVENEIGMLTEARERTPEADKAFGQPVPAALMNYLQKNKADLVPELKQRWAENGYKTKGNWEEVFGKGLATDEIFQAWYYAEYANAVAEAGKAQYPLPMFVNAALNHRNVKPGEYPSAGPLPQVMDIWQAAAPAIDMLSPDFYNPNFKYWNDLYVRRNNTLLIPEIRFEPSASVKALYAIGHYRALGFSPFSIESVADPEKEPLRKSYHILEQLAPLILQNRGKGTMDAALVDKQNAKQTVSLGKYTLTVSHDYTLGWSPKAKEEEWPITGGIIIQTGADDFIIAGTGIVVTFQTSKPSNETVGIATIDEGAYVEGKWVPGRKMNGDQSHQGRHLRFATDDWGIQRITLYRYK